MTLLQAFCPFCRACQALMRIMTGLVFVCAALVFSAGAAASGREFGLVGPRSRDRHRYRHGRSLWRRERLFGDHAIGRVRWW